MESNSTAFWKRKQGEEDLQRSIIYNKECLGLRSWLVGLQQVRVSSLTSRLHVQWEKCSIEILMHTLSKYSCWRRGIFKEGSGKQRVLRVLRSHMSSWAAICFVEFMCFMCVTLVHGFLGRKRFSFQLSVTPQLKKSKMLKTALLGAEACCCSHDKHDSCLAPQN